MEKNTQNSLLLTPEEENIYEAGLRASKSEKVTFFTGILVGVMISTAVYMIIHLILYGF